MVNKKYTLRMQSVICSNSIYVYLSFVPLLLGINSACYGESQPVCRRRRRPQSARELEVTSWVDVTLPGRGSQEGTV